MNKIRALIISIVLISVIVICLYTPLAGASCKGEATVSDTKTVSISVGTASYSSSISVPSSRCGYFITLKKVIAANSVAPHSSVTLSCIGSVVATAWSGFTYSVPGEGEYSVISATSGNPYGGYSNHAMTLLGVNIFKSSFNATIQLTTSGYGCASTYTELSGVYRYYDIDMDEVSITKYSDKINLQFTNQGAPYNIYYRIHNETTGNMSNWVTQSSLGANNANWDDTSVNENTSYSYTVDYSFDPNISYVTRNIGEVVIDTMPPSGNIDVPMNSNSNTVVVSLDADDNVVVNQMRFSIDNINWSTWEMYSTQKQYTVLNDGSYTLYVQFRDTAGNISIGNICKSFTVDTTPPNGDIETSSGVNYVGATVQLVLDANDSNGVAQMRIAQASDFSSSAWQSYTGSYVYTVTGEDGPKTLYVKYRDAAGNESPVYSINVIKDTVGPSNCTIDLQGKEGITGETKSQSITVVATGEDANGIYGIQISNDNSSWTPTCTVKVGEEFQYVGYLLTEGRGIKTVYVRILDAAGNYSLVTDSIKYDEDTTLPSCSINIKALDGSEIYTTNPSVNLTVVANDNATFTNSLQVRFSNDGEHWSAYTPFSASNTWNIITDAGGTNTEGIKTVYVNVRDEAGNVGYAFDSIAYSSTKPSTSTSEMQQLIDSTNDPNINVRVGLFEGQEVLFADVNVVYVPLPLEGITSYRIAVGGADYGEWSNFNSSAAQKIQLGLGEGLIEVRIQGRNTNGALSDEHTLQFMVDCTPPVIKNLCGKQGATATKNDSFVVIAEVTDNRSKTINYRYNINGGVWSALALLGNSGAKNEVVIPGLMAGINEIAFECSDINGNIATQMLNVFRL